jgi:murein endopeptidase
LRSPDNDEQNESDPKSMIQSPHIASRSQHFLICFLWLVFLANCRTIPTSQPTPAAVDLEGSKPDQTRIPAAFSDAIKHATLRLAEHSWKEIVISDTVFQTRLLLGSALIQATDRVSGWRALPEDSTAAQILEESKQIAGSLSLGTVGKGELKNGSPLPLQSVGLEVIERHRSNRTQFGTDELVSLIVRAGGQVLSEHGGAPLRIGNASRRGGGDIRWSRSHNSGRDLDIAFYLRDSGTGESVPAPDLISLRDSGQAIGAPHLFFDVSRNWALVRSLLSQHEVPIQWLFVSEGLKVLLLGEAKRLGETETLVLRASTVLHQPTDAPPHNDHFHLRIRCSLQDRLEGCLDTGPIWSWQNDHRASLLARSLRLSECFTSGTTAEKIAALRFLERIQSPYRSAVALVFGLGDVNPSVRQEALRVARGSRVGSVPAIIAAVNELSQKRATHDERMQLFGMLGWWVDPISRASLAASIGDETLDIRLRVRAAESLSHDIESELLEDLIMTLRSAPPYLAVILRTHLQRIANHRSPLPCTRSRCDSKTLADWWARWHTKMAPDENDAWLLAGFGVADIKIGSLDWSAMDALINDGLTHHDPHIQYNANRTLRRITGRWAPRQPNKGTRRYWVRWWKKNRERFAEENQE